MKVFIILGLLGLSILATAAARGGRAALWWGWPFGMLMFFVGLKLDVPGGMRVDAHTVTIVSLTAGLLIGGGLGPLSLRWSLCDALVVLMMVGQQLSDITNNKYTTLGTPAIICYTILPYAFGRLYLRAPSDIPRALRPLALCVLLLTLCIGFEAITGINVFRVLGGLKYRVMLRVGLNRTYGSLSHPIFMGLAMVSLLPWALEAARGSRAGAAPWWWQLLPWALLAAVFCTLSRGPLMAFVLASGIYLFFRRPAWRLPLAAAGLAGVLVVFLAFDQVKSVLYVVSGEQETMQEHTRYLVMPDGEEILYTGTDHRWILFHVYKEQLRHAGVFGYGYGWTGNMIENDRLRLKFYSIDNNLIYYIISYGYLGTTLFFLVALLPLPALARVALDRGNPLAPLSGGVFAAVVAFNLALSAVALMRTYTALWMFLAGLAVSLGQLGPRYSPKGVVARGQWPVAGG